MGLKKMNTSKRYYRDHSGDYGTIIRDRKNNDEDIYEYGIDDSKTLCELLNEIDAENSKTIKAIHALKHMDAIEPVTNFKELLKHNIQIADSGAEHYYNAWNEYVLLRHIWDIIYPNEEWDD